MTRVTQMSDGSPMPIMDIVRRISCPKLGKGFKRGTITRWNQICVFKMFNTRQKVALAFRWVFQEKFVSPCWQKSFKWMSCVQHKCIVFGFFEWFKMFRVYFGFKLFENFQKLLSKLLSSTLPKDGIKPRPCGPSLLRVDRAYCQFVVPHFGGRHIVRFKDCLNGFFNCSYQPIRWTFWMSN